MNIESSDLEFVRSVAELTAFSMHNYIYYLKRNLEKPKENLY